jgi:ACS family glucarate transporter-like MFS transporter
VHPKRHVVLGYLVALSIITYLDRLCIAVAGPAMQRELGLSPEQWGWVLGVFMLSYGIFEIPTGALGDRQGQRTVLTRIVVWWSVFTALTGVVTGYVPLLITRFLFGAGEAGAYPNASGAVSRWFPLAERARAQGFIWGASRIGGAIAPPLVFAIQAALGWRASFWIFGLVGIVWAVVWFVSYRDLPVPEGQVHSRVPWRAMFSSPRLWLIMSMYWCYVWGSFFYLSWFHTYLVKGRGFSESDMAKYAPLPFVLGAMGNVFGGWLSDSLTRRYGSRVGRTLFGGSCLAGAAALMLAASQADDSMNALVLLAVGFGVMDCMLPAAWAMCLDIGGAYAGAITGAMNSAGQFGGFVCSVVFGHIVQRYGDYNLPLVLIAGVVGVSALLFWRIDPTRPLILQEETTAWKDASSAARI